MDKKFELKECQQCTSFHCDITPLDYRPRNLGGFKYLSVFECVTSCDRDAFKETRIILNGSDILSSIYAMLEALIEGKYVPNHCPRRHCFIGKDSKNSMLLDKLCNIMGRYDIPEDTIFGVSNAFGEELSKLN